MPVRSPLRSHGSRQRRDGPERLLLVPALFCLLAFAVLAWALPAALVMPALSALLVAGAAAAGLAAWWRQDEARRDRIRYWDVAGALTLLGICAALLGDSEAVMASFEARLQRG